MKDFVILLPNTFIPIFVAIDLFWLLPIFTSYTGDMPRERRRRVIRQSIATAFGVSVAFTLVGEMIFSLLGISVNDFKVAGGTLLLVLAILDLTSAEYKEKLMATETIGVVPIGVPLIVGPALLTTCLVLVDHYGMLPTMVSLLLNLLLVWIAFSAAERIIRFLGSGGIAALSKIMAILLASIAVMMVRRGVEGYLAR